MVEWFNSIAAQAKEIADSLAEQIQLQAQKAQEELEHEQLKIRQELESQQSHLTKVRLPWETDDESLDILSQDCMERVFQLSLSERNFTISSDMLSDIEFNFQEYVPIIMKLLSIDTNLSNIHAKLSPKMNEEIFWCNYYRRAIFLRSIIGLDGEQVKEKYLPYDLDNIIFAPSFENDYQARKDMKKSTDSLDNKLINQENKLSDEEQKEKQRLAEEIAFDAEIEEELRNGDINLSDLDGLSPDGDDYIDVTEDNEDLEAQIARELAEDSDLVGDIDIDDINEDIDDIEIDLDDE